MKVLIIGAQDYCVEWLSRIIPAIKPTHLLADGENKLKDHGLIEINSFSEVAAVNPDLILSAKAPGLRDQTRLLVDRLADIGFEVDHIQHFRKIEPFVGTYLLKDLNKYEYTDYSGNKIVLMKSTSDNIFIKYNAGARNNTIEFGENLQVSKKISIECFGDRSSITIGDSSKFVEVSVETGSDNNVNIGDDCMFSAGIILSCTDQHPIFDLNTRERINKSKNINIGNHVWVGRDARILGGAEINDGSIVGNHAITSSKYKKNVAIAGCPARVVRENILWANDNLKFNDMDRFDQCKDQSALKYL